MAEELPHLRAQDGPRPGEKPGRSAGHRQVRERTEARVLRSPRAGRGTCSDKGRKVAGHPTAPACVRGAADRCHHRAEGYAEREQPIEDERPVELDRSGVPVRHAAIDPEEETIEPADRCRVDDREQAVPSSPQRRRSEVPGDEDRVDEENGRDRVDRHRPPAPCADRKGDRGGPGDAGEGEKRRGAQIGGRPERPVRRGAHPEERGTLEEENGEGEVNADRDAESRRDTGELADGVLHGGKRRSVQEIADPRFVVANHREAGHQRGEEGIREEAPDGEALRQCMRRVGERPFASHLGLARWDHRHRIERARDGEEDHEQDPESRAPQLSPGLVPRDRGEPCPVHEAAWRRAGASPSPARRIRTR